MRSGMLKKAQKTQKYLYSWFLLFSIDLSIFPRGLWSWISLAYEVSLTLLSYIICNVKVGEKIFNITVVT